MCGIRKILTSLVEKKAQYITERKADNEDKIEGKGNEKPNLFKAGILLREK